MPNNSGNRRGGFWGGVGNVARGAGRRIGSAIRNSPGGHLVHGEFREAFGATPVGMLVNALRNAGSNGCQSTSGPGAFGTMAVYYAGVTCMGSPLPLTHGFVSEIKTDCGNYVQPDPIIGPPQYSAPNADPSINQYGPNSSRTMGTGAFGSGMGATGANLMGMMGAGGLLRQSGDSGLGRQRPQQN
jgi:hypothetical protein